MRSFILLALCLLTSCSSGANSNQQAVKQVTEFYTFYLNAFQNEPPPSFTSPEMRRYVADETLKQLDIINHLPEPDIFNADYFTYGQEYDPAWIAALNVGPVKDSGTDKVVDVWLGIQDGKHEHLEAFLKQEGETWKIYRVRDISSGYESPIFDNAAIEKVRRGSAN